MSAEAIGGLTLGFDTICLIGMAFSPPLVRTAFAGAIGGWTIAVAALSYMGAQ